MTSPLTQVEERVVLLDGDGHSVGTALKALVHGAETPLHLAFSCYLFTGDSVLMTRRADGKRTFPGVWTNSVCGHPLPGEALVPSIRRRVHDELGVEVADLRLVLPRFRYRAQMAGVEEHEWCPVVTGTMGADVALDLTPDEVSAWELVPWPELVARARDDESLSPWCREQIPQLAALGPDPAAWPAADVGLLPPALHWD
jgi:isopentenyl-diphosphate delta-isomerase